jgi:hypothetical protein
MNVTQVLSARAVRFVSLGTSGLYIPDAIRLVQQRYGFVRFPDTPKAILAPLKPDANQPLVFRHGKLVHEQRPILIEAMEFYRQLVAVDTPNTTDDADLVLDDFLAAVNPEALKLSGQRRAYQSQLEVTLDAPLEAIWPTALTLGTSLASMLARYLDDAAPIVPWQLASIGLLTDPKQRTLPADFRVERRLNSNFDQNLYYAHAPLRTGDHIAALNELETWLKVQARAAALKGA